jgi:microsomal epoxide hydrolase
VTSEPPANIDESNITEDEKQAMATRGAAFGMTGNAYAREHGTRPATIGFVLASSPLAQLAW